MEKSRYDLSANPLFQCRSLTLYDFDTSKLSDNDPWLKHKLWKKSGILNSLSRRPNTDSSTLPFFPHTDTLLPYWKTANLEDTRRWFSNRSTPESPVWKIIHAFCEEGFGELISYYEFENKRKGVARNQIATYALSNDNRQVICEARILKPLEDAYQFVAAAFSRIDDGKIIATYSRFPNAEPPNDISEQILPKCNAKKLLKAHLLAIGDSAQAIEDVAEFQQRINSIYVQGLIERGVLHANSKLKKDSSRILTRAKETEFTISVREAIDEGDADSIQYLFDQKPDLKESSQVAKFAFEAAVKQYDCDMIEALPAAGLDINISRRIHEVPLAYAVKQQSLKMVEFLLGKGADPNASRVLITVLNNRFKETALPMVELLANAGADLNLLYDVYGDKGKLFTALDFAQAAERNDIVEFLRQRGGKSAKEVEKKIPVPQPMNGPCQRQIRLPGIIEASF